MIGSFIVSLLLLGDAAVPTCTDFAGRQNFSTVASTIEGALETGLGSAPEVLTGRDVNISLPPVTTIQRIGECEWQAIGVVSAQLSETLEYSRPFVVIYYVSDANKLRARQFYIDGVLLSGE